LSGTKSISSVPVDELCSHNPVLAEHLSVLSKGLEIAGLCTHLSGKQMRLSMDERISLEDEARMHLRLAKDWEKLLETIRNIPQFRDFLQPRRSADIYYYVQSP